MSRECQELPKLLALPVLTCYIIDVKRGKTMIGKLVRHIELDAIGIVVDHFVYSEFMGGYKVKFLKPVQHTHLPSGFMEDIIGKVTSFEEVTNESR